MWICKRTVSKVTLSPTLLFFAVAKEVNVILANKEKTKSIEIKD